MEFPFDIEILLHTYATIEEMVGNGAVFVSI